MTVGLSAQEGISPADVANLKTVQNATISDNGNYAAFTLLSPRDPYEENRPPRLELFVQHIESGETRPFYSDGPIAGVAFRPGHRSLTFLTRQEGDQTRSLYEIPLDGGEAQRLYSFDRNILSYEWAPGGERIMFVAPEDLELEETTLPYEPEIYEEDQPQRHGFIADLSREEPEPVRIRTPGSIYLASWSREGDRLAITAAPTPHIDDDYMAQQVRVIEAASGEEIARVDNEGKIGQVVWSPDGHHLALRAGRDIHDPIDGRILIVSSDGGEPTILHPEFEGKFEQIEWNRQDRIHFLASESVWTTFGTIRPDGTGLTYQVERETGPAKIDFDRAGDGTLLFRASDPAHPAELYLMETNDQKPHRITRHNRWLGERTLGRQEVVSYEARDGEFRIDGLLIYPTGHTEGEPFPLITVVHGGPEAHYSHGWLTRYADPGQMGATEGYGVFYPNYRGSTGRGIEFVHSSQGDAGGKEFDDIVDGVDALIDCGMADPDRIGVTGGSYGGYASGWMATRYSDRFAASVMFVGVSNNISKWGTSDIPEELYLVHARERIWDDNWMKYLERSPIYWVDRADTPLLILHGSEDTRVHPSQSLELYRHMKVRRPDVPLRLVFYPDEGHGNLRSTSRYDYSLRMMRWFDTYLKTGDRRADPPSSVLHPAD